MASSNSENSLPASGDAGNGPLKVAIKKAQAQKGPRFNKSANRSKGIEDLISMIASDEHIEELRNDYSNIFGELCNLYKLSKEHTEAVIVQLSLNRKLEFSLFVNAVSERLAVRRNPQERTFILRCLEAALASNLKHMRVLMNDATSLMTLTTNTLSVSEEPGEVVHLFSLVITIAGTFPQIFPTFLTEVVDYALGWLLDPSDLRGKSTIIKKCFETITAISPFLSVDVEKAGFYLKNLANDASDALKPHFDRLNDTSTPWADASSKTEPEPTLMDDIYRFNSIVKAFVAFLEASVNDRNRHKYSELIKDPQNTFNGIVGNLLKLRSTRMYNTLKPVSKALVFMVQINGDEVSIGKVLEVALAAITHSQSMPNNAVEQFGRIKSFISNNFTAKEILTTAVFDTDFLTQVDVENKEVAAALADVISMILNPTDFTRLPKAYSAFVGVLKALRSNFSPPRSTALFATLLAALQTLLRAKNSLIVMNGISPPLHTLIFEELAPVDPTFITSYPLAHMALLYATKYFADGHDLFVAEGIRLAANQIKQEPGFYSMTTDLRNGKCFWTMIDLLTTLMAQAQRLTNDTLRLVLLWMNDVLTKIVNPADLQIFLMADATLILRQHVAILGFNVVERCLQSQRQYQRINRILDVTNALPLPGTISATVFWKRFANGFNGLSEAKHKKFMSFFRGGGLITPILNNALGNALEERQGSIHLGPLSVRDFVFLTSFLMQQEPPIMGKASDSAFIAAGILLRSLSGTAKGRLPVPVLASQWRTAVDNLALFCVENRMKTPFGKTNETFTSINAAVSALIIRHNDVSSSAAPVSERLQYSLVPADSRHANLPKPQAPSPTEGVSSIEWTRNRLRPVEELLRVHSLLSFVSALDKLMAFAERGSIRPFVDISPGARQFFVNNVEPCQAWVTTRVTMAMLQACQHAGRHAEVVRFAMNVLITTKLKAVAAQTTLKYDDFSRLILLSLVRALVELSAPQAIHGVYKYAMTIFDTDLEYVWPAMDAAASRYEAALSQIELILSVEGSVHDAVRAFLHDLRFSVLKKLRNPVLWRNSIATVPLPPGEAVEVDRRRHEALILAEAIEEPTGGSSRLSAGVSVPWELERRLDDFELRLMAIHARMGAVYGNKNTRFNRPDDQLNEYRSAVDEQMKQISSEIQDYAAAVSSLGVSDVFHAKFAALDAIRRNVSRCAAEPSAKADSDGFIDGSFLNDWRLHTTDRIAIGEQLCSWTTKLGSPTNYWNAHVAMARLSLKTGNIDTARGHLARLQNAVPPGPSPTPGYAPNGLRIQPVNLEFAVQTAKLSRIAPTVINEPNEAFFRLSQVLCAQDVILCSPSVSPAPGMMRSDPEFVDKVQAIRRGLLKLGKWVRGDTFGKMAQIDATNRVMPNRLWDSVIKRYNFLLGISVVTEREEPLEGALYWTASELATNLTPVPLPFPKAQLHLAEWTHSQLYEEDGSFALTAIETETLRQFGFESSHPKFAVLRRLLGEIHDYKLFQIELGQALEDPTKIAIVESLEFFTAWHAIKNRQKSLFDICLRSHLSFLAQFELGSTAHPNPGSIDTVTATLRILHALVTHPELFHGAIGGDTWLSLTNVRLWTAVIPQLFARLNHPNNVVRKVICDLLSRIGSLAPHAICFPAIVGAYFSKSISLSTSTEAPGIAVGQLESPYELEEDVPEAVDPKQDSSRMSAACLTLVEHLSANYPKLVADVTLFIKELTRINMLHEEKWCFVLNNLDIEMKRRINQLEAEATQTLNSKYLDEGTAHVILEDRADIFTAGIAEILADLFKSTCGGAYDEAEPETDAALLSPNERRFRDEFAGELADALDHFVRNRIDDPREAWIPFKKLVTLLNQRSSKKASLSLATSDMSPWLAAMNGTAVPLPGQELCPADEVVTIRSMKEHVSVLLTKTRPKKITFVGSDGKEYVFLFKGQEDLHLDERAMQLLQICNLMLSEKRTVNAGDAWPAYACRHYSVTPLGIRSGLIRWVEGATPMFQIYRKWRQRMVTREAAKNAIASGIDVTALPKPPNERPMDLFFQQLKTVFGALNLPPEVIQDRKRWPLDALRQVHDSLVKITPRDILSRELWFAAGTADTWWRVTQRFARSTAAASMIGAVIGLGDRHMENLLIDLASGEVVHIDYNVCFDKGRQLRVPETVPFRLTGNINCALGPTQTEGTFRQSCEHILSVLRAGRHTLLSMLDAFVYDPLVDWAMADHHAAGGSTTVNTNTILAVYGGSDRTTKLSAKEVTLELFQLRMREFRQPWKEASEGLQKVLQRTLVFLPQLARIPTATRIRYAENIAEMTKDMHSIIREYSNLAGIFRPLVKALGHTDERFRDYLKSCYAQLSDRLARGFKLMSESPTFDVDQCTQLFGSVVDHVMEVHDALVKLSEIKELRSGPSEQEKQSNEPKRLKESENAHAKLISKRIRRRLEGREVLMTVKDAEAGRTSKRLAIDAPLCAEGPEMNPEEQVAMLISSATNPDNLAFMYEGWTAWV
uniref:non-specific serine/threonine protein kinase n=1 Tax=Panagrellus redivivus TaxID=6233 RepID=A0A7E4VT79_PANRE